MKNKFFVLDDLVDFGLMENLAQGQVIRRFARRGRKILEATISVIRRVINTRRQLAHSGVGMGKPTIIPSD
jgi:hypothetical protein